MMYSMIMKLFDKYRPLAPGQIKNIIPPEEKRNLFVVYGPYYNTIMKNGFDIRLHKENTILRSMTYMERLRHIYPEDRELTRNEWQQERQFKDIIEKNNINQEIHCQILLCIQWKKQQDTCICNRRS